MSISIDTSEVYALSATLDRSSGSVGAPAAAVVRKTARAIERDAKANVPVETGTLRESISTSIEGDGRFASMSASIIASARYAGYVEYGTSDTAPEPFMRPAFDRHIGTFERGMADIGGDIL